LEEAIEHDEVHAAVAAELLRDLAFLLPEGMLMVLEGVDGGPGILAGLAGRSVEI